MNWLNKLLRAPIAAIALLAWGTAAFGAADAARVNVNTADAAAIAAALNGVGLKKAQAIVAYREANGRFDAPIDLAKVKGIGAAIVEKNAARIAVSETERGAGGQSRGGASDAGADGEE